jgi:hypothetical protein
LQNGRRISAGNYFSTDKFVDRVHVSVDRPGVLGPPWTDGGADRGGPGHGGALTGGGAKGIEEHGELGSGLTGARVALWRPGDGGAEPGGGGTR